VSRWRAAALLTVLGLPGAVPAAAQEHPRDRSAGPRHARQEVFRMIDAYLASNLQESLGLSDEQLTRVLPLVRRLQSDRRQLVQRRSTAMHELRRSLASGTATEARVQELLRELKAVEAEEPATLRRDLDAIDAVLNPLQQAKYRVLEVEVDRRIRAAMMRMRAERGMGGRRRPRPEPSP
jgi:hypothetical protein